MLGLKASYISVQVHRNHIHMIVFQTKHHVSQSMIVAFPGFVPVQHLLCPTGPNIDQAALLRLPYVLLE